MLITLAGWQINAGKFSQGPIYREADKCFGIYNLLIHAPVGVILKYLRCPENVGFCYSMQIKIIRQEEKETMKIFEYKHSYHKRDL